MLSGTLSQTIKVGVTSVAVFALSLTGQTTSPQEWRDYAGGPDSSRYVRLNQINKSNVDKLDVAWSYPYAITGFNPIVAHGMIYTKARNNAVVAIDASNGKEVWVHEDLPGIAPRGMNYWESADGKDRRLIFCISDFLQEIDATTGKFIRSFGANGAVDLRDAFPDRDPKTIRVQGTTPGKIYQNLILLGSCPGEGYFSAPGDFRAYNVLTGKLVWTFHTVPHPGEFGYDTWPKDAWKYIGGNNTWGEISVDDKRGIAYFPTGSPTFDFYGADRPGANLFGDCLIAVDARSGKRLWHFQMVHHDLWDYDNTAAPMLTTITHNGRKRDIVAMAGKTSFLYVFDRVTGEPIWPIEEKPVPTKTDMVGETLSPTQPMPTAPPPFASQKFTAADVDTWILPPDQRANMKDRVASARNEGMFTPIGFSEVIHMPGNNGGANWGATSSNPNDGTVYVIGFNVPAIMRLLKPGEARGGGANAAAQGPGTLLYNRNCATCHGPNRAGNGSIPSLLNLTARMSLAEIRKTVVEGRGQMPGFHTVANDELDSLMGFLASNQPAGGGGRGRGGPFTDLPPGPVVETGPAATRPGPAFGRGGGAQDYPEGVDHPENRYTMDGYGLYPGLTKPPYTTLTSYDLNKGTIRWQVGLGDDFRVTSKGGPTGTGAAQTFKGGMIPTSGGLVFVSAADRRIHIYDAANGKELRKLSLGGSSSGSPSMYELNGKQYFLVAAQTGVTTPSADPAETGPVGLVAFALKNDTPAKK